MRSDISLAAVFYLVLSAGAQTATRPPEREFRVVPIGTLTRVIRQPAPATRGSLIWVTGNEPGNSKEEPTGWGPAFPTQEPFELVSPDALVNLVTTIHAGAWEGEGISIRHEPALGLLLSNKPAAVEAAATLVQDLTTVLARKVFLDVQLFAVDSDPGLAVVLDRTGLAAAEQQLRALKGARLLWAGSAEGVSGECLAPELVRVRSYVGDYGVEVAEKAKIADPTIHRLLEGIRIRAVPHFTVDSKRIALFLFATVAHPALIESFHPNTDGLGSIDRPTLDQSQLQASAVVDPGGGLALAATGASEQGGAAFVLLVKCTAEEPGRFRNPELRVWPLAAMTSAGLDGAYPLSAPFHWDARHETEQAEARQPMDVNQTIEMLKEATPDAWDGAKHVLAETGHHLLVANRPDVLQRIGALLSGLEREILAVHVAEITVLGVPDTGSFLESPAGAGAPQAAADLAALAPAAVVLSRVAVPLVSSREAFFLRGRESSLLADYNVEIAQSSAIASPVVRVTFSGLIGRIRMTSSGDEPSASVHVVMTDCRTTRRPVEEKGIGDLDRESASRVVLERHHRFKEGEKLTLGEGVPLHVKGTAYRTLVQVSIRKG